MTQSKEDEAAKERIIKHMNSDHQDSLVRYLEHYCHLSSFSARNAKLNNATLDSLSISTGQGKVHLVPIRPPMAAWSEVRTRLAELDAQAVQGLGRSNITVKKYTRPTGFMALPGSIIYDVVLRHVAGFARFCYTIQPFVLYPTLAIHIAESIQMHRSRLRKHNVPTCSRLWWLWIGSTFMEGVGAFIRIDRIVKEEGMKKASAKH